MGDNPEGLVQWNKFSKDESVWLWIDGILDLIKKYLVDIWRDGHIMGFVSKQRTRSLLQNKPSGTFLIRFSESIRDGAITFSWVDHHSGETHVHAVEPYTKTELSLLSLPDAIINYTLTTQGRSANPLIYLYPDIPKESVFSRYNKPSEPSPANKKKKEYISRTITLVSINPTPPPSPPRDMRLMEVDLADAPAVDLDQILEDLFSFDLPELPNLPQLFPDDPGVGLQNQMDL